MAPEKEEVSHLIDDIKFGCSRSNQIDLSRWVLPLADAVSFEFKEPKPKSSDDSLEARAKSKGSLMAMDSDYEHFVSIILYMKVEFGSWASGKVYDYIAERLTSIIKEKLTNKKYPGTIKLSTLYKNGTVVTLEIPAESQYAIDSLPILFESIQQGASLQSQIEQPRSGYVYQIKNGELQQKK